MDITSSMYMYLYVKLIWEKKKIWRCPMTKTLMPTDNSKTNWQHKNATKNVDYTMIAYRLRTVMPIIGVS